MQTVNNNFTVEALVAKYRNFVDEHCPKESYWDPKEGNISRPLDPIDCYAEAHLLVTLYKRIAGENTDQNILEALSKYTTAFYTNALNEEEMDFLANHFSKVSTFILTTLLINTPKVGLVDLLKRFMKSLKNLKK